MNAPGRQTSPSVPEPWRPRFSLATLLLVMLLFSVMAALGSYMFKSLGTDTTPSSRLVFMLCTLAAPMLVMVIVSVGWQVFLWLERSRRK